MKILAVCTSARVFGVEIATLTLLRALKRRGHDLLAVTSSWTDGTFSQHLAKEGISEVQMPIGVLSKNLRPQAMWWTFNSLVRAPRMWCIWSSTVNSFKPNVVILTNPKHGLWLYPWIDRQPTFLIDHALKAASRSNRWMYGRLDRKLSGFVAVSNFIAKHLRDLGVPREHVHVIYNCTPDDIESSTTNSLINWPADATPVIGIVGQISNHKGHDILLKAAEILHRRCVPFQVAVYGSGSAKYITELNQQLAQSSLTSKWKWMSYSSDRDEIYKQIDILSIPSRCEEAFGMTAVEAAIRRIPVVATRRGALPEIIDDGRTGWLFEPEDPGDLAAKLEELIQHPKKARDLGDNACSEARLKFSEQKMLSEFEKLFQNHTAA